MPRIIRVSDESRNASRNTRQLLDRLAHELATIKIALIRSQANLARSYRVLAPVYKPGHMTSHTTLERHERKQPRKIAAS